MALTTKFMLNNHCLLVANPKFIAPVEPNTTPSVVSIVTSSVTPLLLLMLPTKLALNESPTLSPLAGNANVPSTCPINDVATVVLAMAIEFAI